MVYVLQQLVVRGRVCIQELRPGLGVPSGLCRLRQVLCGPPISRGQAWTLPARLEVGALLSLPLLGAGVLGCVLWRAAAAARQAFLVGGALADAGVAEYRANTGDGWESCFIFVHMYVVLQCRARRPLVRALAAGRPAVTLALRGHLRALAGLLEDPDAVFQRHHGLRSFTFGVDLGLLLVRDPHFVCDHGAVYPGPRPDGALHPDGA
mmetsp:Transcript_84127/g.271272  ORF Transcript_84127/g.271272 Transcript_84127/m.271272 type:complete len:208 (+) Transcript_84127:795-1418(+)